MVVVLGYLALLLQEVVDDQVYLHGLPHGRGVEMAQKQTALMPEMVVVAVVELAHLEKEI